MNVAFITLEQMNILTNQEFTNSCLFNPIQIGTQSTNAAFITESELINCDNPDFLWVKDLPIVEWSGTPLTVTKISI